ncbi:hypothetical protein GCM10017691_63800 [Pseudonocardia petroleophila]
MGPVSRCAARRPREAEVDRMAVALTVLCLLALVATAWPAAGVVIAWSVGAAAIVVVVLRRVRSAREVARRSR